VGVAGVTESRIGPELIVGVTPSTPQQRASRRGGPVSPETGITIPADWLAGRPPLPDRCVRHGQPAARRVDIVLRSKPPASPRRRPWATGRGSLERAAERLQLVRIVVLRGWPLCSRCVRRRSVALGLANTLFFGGLIAVVAALVLRLRGDTGTSTLLAPVVGGFVAMAATTAPLEWGGLSRLARATVTPDGAAVHVADPHPTFVAQLSEAR
jgi:hypothetical protein